MAENTNKADVDERIANTLEGISDTLSMLCKSVNVLMILKHVELITRGHSDAARKKLISSLLNEVEKAARGEEYADVIRCDGDKVELVRKD